jgi:hypothetical protein
VKAINVLLAILVSVVMALAVFEGGLRLIPAFRPQPTLNRFDPKTGWSKIPGLSVVRTVAGERIEFAFNEHGLRDDPGVGPGKPAGKLRVLALGDSFVLGYTVQRADLFVDLLERRWNAEGREVDVVNAGTEGWSTDQEVVWFLEHGRAYAPDLVLLFTFDNDLYWCGEERYTRIPKPRFGADGALEARELADPGPGSPLHKSAIGSFLGKSLAAVLERPSERTHFEAAEHANPGPIWIPREFAPLLREPPSFVADGVARAESAVVALDRACREARARLVIVPIPSKSVVHADEREFFRTWDHGLNGLDDAAWSPDRPVEIFLEIARRHGIAALDPRAALVHAGADRKLYFERDTEWHLNAHGNRALASYLHDALDSLEPPVFPESHRAKTAVAAVDDPPDDPPARRWPWVFAALWLAASALYVGTYADERDWKAPLKVGLMLAVIFAIVLGGGALIARVPAEYSSWILGGFVALVLGFVAYKLGRRIGTIFELLSSFVARGHWYLMPLLVVLLSVGSLLVVAASSPLIAPFIYTLF